jgi:hypothetical protein
MRNRNRTLATLACLLIAGCLESSPSTEPSSIGSVRTGTLEGRIVDDESQPLGWVEVALVDLAVSTQTDTEGRFAFHALAPGATTLVLSKGGYQAASLPIEIVAGETTTVQASLTRVSETTPYSITQIFEGHYECAHEIPIWTGDCMILYAAATDTNDSLTSEEFHFRFDIGPAWETVVMELVWTASANNQLDGMRFSLERLTGDSTDHGVKVARADGNENPLRFVVQRAFAHPSADRSADGEPEILAPEGSPVQSRVFPMGRLYDESCALGQATIDECTLGIGFGLDIRFTVYATVFYHAAGPHEFSAVPDT